MIFHLNGITQWLILVNFLLGLLKNPEESAQLASSVPDADGVYFVPAFSGLQVKRKKFLKNKTKNKNVY
jgi:glycerol kinase